MKTITVSKNARSIMGLLKQACKENIIIRSPDGIEFILAEIDDFDREIELTRQNKELMKFLDRRAKHEAAIPLEDVKREPGI
jgi:hypothetical protein